MADSPALPKLLPHQEALIETLTKVGVREKMMTAYRPSPLVAQMSADLAWPRGGLLKGEARRERFRALPTPAQAAPEPRLIYSRYRLPRGGERLTQVFCRDAEHAKALMAQRGMGEEIDGRLLTGRKPILPSEHLWAGSPAKALHALTWLLMIAQNIEARQGDVRDAFYDDGLLHELAHIVEDAGSGYYHAVDHQPDRWSSLRIDLFKRLAAFERVIPGAHPTHGLDAAGAKLWLEAQDAQVAMLDGRDEVPSLVRGASKAFALQQAVMSSEIDGLEGTMLRGAKTFDDLKIVLDEFAYIKHKPELVNDVLLTPETAPKTPDKRGFDMHSVAQGRSAKAARIDKIMADMKARKRKPVVGIDPAKPGSDRTGFAIMEAAT